MADGVCGGPGIVGSRDSNESAASHGRRRRGRRRIQRLLLPPGGYVAPLNAGRRLASDDSRYDNDKVLWLNLLGRRREALGLAQVRAELDVIAAQIDQQQPGRSTMLTIERAGADDAASSFAAGQRAPPPS